MKRLAIATLVVTIANVAHADAPRGDPCKTDDAKVDEIANIEGCEANLESKERRKGFTFSAAAGLGIMIGGDTGVGRGFALSLRLGHVATRRSVITFEFVGTSVSHKRAMTSDPLTDSNVGLFVGGQRYLSSSLWVRAAGGLTILVKNAKLDGSEADPAIAGLGGLVGGGLELARLRYLNFGLEVFGMTSVSRDGVKAQLAVITLDASLN